MKPAVEEMCALCEARGVSVRKNDRQEASKREVVETHKYRSPSPVPPEQRKEWTDLTRVCPVRG